MYQNSAPGPPGQHEDPGGLQPQSHIPTANQERTRKSSLITGKTEQRKTSFVSFDEITTSIEKEETKEDEEKEENDNIAEETGDCSDEGNTEMVL